MKRASQCDRILEVLSDGEPHSMEAIHERVGTCRLNSRVAELRARGYTITCDKTGGRYVYQLVAPPEQPQPSTGNVVHRTSEIVRPPIMPKASVSVIGSDTSGVAQVTEIGLAGRQLDLFRAA